MDSHHFDALTRRLVSRRTGVGLTLAGVLGIGVPAAEASRKRKNKNRKKKDAKLSCGADQRCFGADCATCANDAYYSRFATCVGDRAFCEVRREGCCAFCAKWAKACNCCSG